MSQEFNQAVFDQLMKMYYEGVKENNIDKHSDFIRNHSITLMKVLAEESLRAMDTEEITEEEIYKNDEKFFVLEKMYLSLDEIKPDFLREEMRWYVRQYCDELEKKLKNNPLPVVNVKVIETFKAPRMADGSKLREFVTKGIDDIDTEALKSVLRNPKNS
jgi:hypothetical protein